MTHDDALRDTGIRSGPPCLGDLVPDRTILPHVRARAGRTDHLPAQLVLRCTRCGAHLGFTPNGRLAWEDRG